MTPATQPDAPRDRAAAVRAAFRRLVADRGFHGASMSAVAREAGVATGTAYLYYASKNELMFAAYLEAKRDLGRAALVNFDHTVPPSDQFRRLWLNVHDHMSEDPSRARFLVQVDSSPFAEEAHARVLEAELDELSSGRVMMDELIDLPPLVIYDLAVGPILRLTAAERKVQPAELERLIDACWRAITPP